jgi:hypothetical protein
MSTATLTPLDSSLYPQVWEQQTFNDSQSLLKAILTENLILDPHAFAKLTQKNKTYQEWVNASIFGRYIQRSFAALHGQTEDSFNMDIPVLFRNELMRHAQFLPLEQTLYVAGNMPTNTRKEKLITATLNPATVVLNAQKLNQNPRKFNLSNSHGLVINQMQMKSEQVLGFPIRHNKRTSERIRNEVLVLGFKDLRLVKEEEFNGNNIGNTILLRHYELR